MNLSNSAVSTAVGLLVSLAIVGCSSSGSSTGYQNRAPRTQGTTGLTERWDSQRPSGPSQVATKPAPAPAPAVAPAVVPAARTTCSEATTGRIRLAKTMPNEVVLGETFSYDLNATANECAGNVVITDQIPSGASFVKSEPEAQMEGGRLVWRLGELEPGQSRPIKVWLKADKEGRLASCATVSADPRVCAGTFVGKALLAIDKSGPETAVLGADVAYNIVVSNKGTTVARGVVVTDQVPDGLTSPNGQSQLTFNVGDLAPNQSRTIPVTLKAAKRGKHCNTAVATSSNAGKVSDEACTTVLVPGLKIVKTGDKEHFLGRNARYKVVVSNTGDTALSGVVVTDTAPAQTSIVSADGATVAGNQATWNVGNLAPGAEKSFDVVLTSRVAGSHCNTATVVAAGGLRETSQACTTWRGLGAVLLEVVDDPDPIKVGEDTTYTIRVTNQGTADLNNVRTSAEYDAETTPVSSPQGTVSGQKVSFAPVPKLAPKQSFTYTIVVRGAKEGDSRNRVTIQTDEITRPVVEEESTRVY